ncbi:MAG: alpha/beta hydrolase [Pseudomonadota bacterium]
MIWTTRPRSEQGRLAAIVEGAGPLVVLLHGVGLRAEAWAPQIEAFAAAGYRVVAPDMIGHGQSAMQDATSLSDFAAPVTALLSEPALLVGHSMGAMLALQIAAQECSVVGVAALNAIYRRSPDAREAVRRRAAALDGHTLPDPTPTLTRWFGAVESRERCACADWLGTIDPAAYKAAYTVFAESDGSTDEALAALACPALFMTGAEEPNSTPAMSEAMAAKAPRGASLVLPGAAHMMPMTHAAAVTDQLLAFAAACHSPADTTFAPRHGRP